MIRGLVLVAALAVACSPVKGKPLIDAESVTVESVAVTPATVATSFALDAPTQLTAMAMLSNGATIDVTPDCTWTSGGLAAKVDGNGIVTPLAAGTTMISAAYEGQTGSAQVTVRLPVIVVGASNATPGIDFFPFDATGNVAPMRSIRGSSFPSTTSLAIVPMPATNELYISSVSPGAIYVFPLDGTGNIAPTRSITGATTGITNAYGLQIDNNEIYTIQSGGIISVFPQSGTGNIAPTRTITTGLPAPIGMVIHKNLIYVANQSPGSITVYPETGSGTIAPVQTISGPLTQLNDPFGVMFVGDELYVADPETNAILVFPDDATGNVTPTRAYRGPDSTLAEPVSMVSVGNSLLWLNFDVESVSTVPLEVTSDTAPTSVLSGALTNIATDYSLAVF